MVAAASRAINIPSRLAAYCTISCIVASLTLNAVPPLSRTACSIAGRQWLTGRVVQPPACEPGQMPTPLPLFSPPERLAPEERIPLPEQGSFSAGASHGASPAVVIRRTLSTYLRRLFPHPQGR